MKEFVENFHSFEHSENLHSTDDTHASDDEEDNNHLTIILETEDMDEEIEEFEQFDLEIGKNLDMPITIDDE